MIPTLWAGGGDEVEEAPIHRICTLARKMGVASLVIEDAGSRPEVVDEVRHIEAAGGCAHGEWCATAVTFLRCAPGDPADVSQIQACDVIGQAVVVTFPIAPDQRRSYVYEAVVRLCATRDGSLLLNNHVHLARDQHIRMLDRDIAVAGSYFCQQNGVTSFCGHTAVRTVVMNLTGARVSVEALNAEWAVGASSRRLPRDAVENALKSRGFHVVCYGFSGRRPVSGRGDDGTWTVLTGLVESATPSLLIMSTGPRVDHVVPLLGHTLNTDEWHPAGAQTHLADADGTASSSLWIDHLVLNDDQLGPYYCISRAGLFEKSGQAAAVTPQRVIAVLPEGVTVSPLVAETLARGSLKRLLAATLQWDHEGAKPRWLSFLGTTRERRVFRTILTDKATYLGILRDCPQVAGDGDATEVLVSVEATLPDRFWMVEVSLPNLLLANRARLGELLVGIDGHVPRLLGHRLPGVIGTLVGDDLEMRRLPIDQYLPIHASDRNPNRW